MEKWELPTTNEKVECIFSRKEKRVLLNSRVEYSSGYVFPI